MADIKPSDSSNIQPSHLHHSSSAYTGLTQSQINLIEQVEQNLQSMTNSQNFNASLVLHDQSELMQILRSSPNLNSQIREQLTNAVNNLGLAGSRGKFDGYSPIVQQAINAASSTLSSLLG